MSEDETKRAGRVGSTAVTIGLCLLVGLVVSTRRLPLWRVRRWAARWSVRLPDRWLPMHLRVLPPPDSEYLGVWAVSPTEARRRLAEYGFRPQIRAYLHAYEQGGTMRYEEASYAYRPRGTFGPWQLHVRLFPARSGETAVWCHWERNPTVSPFAHLRQDGYDPAEGKRRLVELMDEPIRVAEEGPIAG